MNWELFFYYFVISAAGLFFLKHAFKEAIRRRNDRLNEKK